MLVSFLVKKSFIDFEIGNKSNAFHLRQFLYEGNVLLSKTYNSRNDRHSINIDKNEFPIQYSKIKF
jgi:hypothetical protein